MNDVLPFKHGQEGTHGACQEMIEKFGGKVGCCSCNGHKCKVNDECRDKDCPLYVKGAVHRKGFILCKYA